MMAPGLVDVSELYRKCSCDPYQDLDAAQKRLGYLVRILPVSTVDKVVRVQHRHCENTADPDICPKCFCRVTDLLVVGAHEAEKIAREYLYNSSNMDLLLLAVAALEEVQL